MTVARIEPGVACLSIPPLQTGRYEYDIFMRHQATSTETRLLRGAITVQSRVASLPPAQSTVEQIDIVISPEHTVLEISLSPVTIVSAADWQQIQEAADRAERAAGQAEATLPALERETAAARTAIEQEADQAARHAAAETAELIAASGEAATSAVRQEASRATAAALESISTAEATVINQATNNGINAIGQSITAGTGAINQTVSNGMALLDGYVGTVSDDLARYSRAGQWSGVQTLNAPLIANGGIIAQGADLIQTLYLSACYDAAAFSTAAGWANQSNGATSGTGYNAIANGTESGVTYYGAIARGTLTLTNADAHAVVKELAIWSDSFEANIGVTAVIRTNSNTFWSDAGAKTAYAIGASMRTSGNVPHETLIDTSYTPNVGNIPTVCLTSDRVSERIRVDIFIKTIHRQILLPKIQNVSHRSYPQEFLCVFGPNRFMLLWLPSYPAADWQCVCSIRSYASLGSLYRSNIIGANGTSSFDIKLSVGTLGLNELTRKGYGDWMEPMTSIQI